MPATRIARDDNVIDDFDTEDAPARHQVRRRRDVFRARARIAAYAELRIGGVMPT
jgi:hypothetical protein